MIEHRDYKQLVRQNVDLRRKLSQAQRIIFNLQSQNLHLKSKLTQYQENSHHNSKEQISSQEIFTDSNKSSQEKFSEQQILEESKQNAYELENSCQNFLSKSKTYYNQQEQISQQNISESSASKNLSVFNYRQQPVHKPKTLERNILRGNQLQFNNKCMKEIINIENNQYNIELSNRQIFSSIIFQDHIPNIEATNIYIGNKLKNNQSIYRIFFVTGFSSQNCPEIIYHYPNHSDHFQAIINLVFNETPQLIKLNDISIKSHKNIFGYKLKDTFIMPVKKQNTEGRETQYLVACQIQDIFYNQKQKCSYSINRLFSFITSCKFFNVFQQMLHQIIKTIYFEKMKQSETFTQTQFRSLLHHQLQQPLNRLANQTFQYNQYLTLCLSSQIKIIIDTPPLDDAYRMVLQYSPWDTLKMKIQIKNHPNFGNIYETTLIGLIVVYLSVETKIVLFSSLKSKLSQVILHSLQIILPLQFVNPIIIANLRQIHQEYINAPISMLMGFWCDNKKSKQKIQIFMNKKQSLQNMLQKNKLQLNDGIVINLDSGIVYGGALQKQLNQLSIQLNQIFQTECYDEKQKYKLFRKMITGKQNLKPQTNKFWPKLLNRIQNTQLYCYYKEQIQLKRGLK